MIIITNTGLLRRRPVIIYLQSKGLIKLIIQKDWFDLTL